MRCHHTLLVFGVIVGLFSASSLCAESSAPLVDTDTGQRQLLIDTSIELPFKPTGGVFVVWADSATLRVPAVIARSTLPPLMNQEERTSAIYWLGALVPVQKETTALRISGLVLGGQGEAVLLPERNLTEQDGYRFRGTIEALRAALEESKVNLASWKVQLGEQEAALTRLRSDAEIIGNLGKIIEARDEVERLKQEGKNLENDLKNLESFIRLAGSQPAPRNLIGRQQQLTRQLAQLADAAARAEQAEGARRAKAEAAIQRKVSLIESTRGEDLGKLQLRLRRLKEERERLESSMRVSEPSE